MSGIFQNIRKYLFLLFVAAVPGLNAQILSDTAAIKLLKEGVDDIYGFRFSEARLIGRELSRAYPGHPVLFLYEGMLTYWSNHPLTPSSKASEVFEKDMTECIRIAERDQNLDNYAEYLLANLGARGMLLLYYADNNLQSKINPMVISTYRYVRESFNYSAVFPDFNFSPGSTIITVKHIPKHIPSTRCLPFFFRRVTR